MIEHTFIPDGGVEIPREAQDSIAVASYLEDTGGQDVDWRDVERVTRRGELVLRLDGSLSDYPGDALDGYATAIDESINGLKAHPDGWVEVEDPLLD
jgi:hypothetical protein